MFASEKEVLVNSGSNTFFTNKYWKTILFHKSSTGFNTYQYLFFIRVDKCFHIEKYAKMTLFSKVLNNILSIFCNSMRYFKFIANLGIISHISNNPAQLTIVPTM